MPTINSIQIGTVTQQGDPQATDPMTRAWTSAFDKRPITGPIDVTATGLVGDAVADRIHHGGVEKAVLCYSAEHYPRWRDEFPALAFAPGGFGENLTISGADESTVCLGDQFQIGDCLFQISQPRQPCWKIARRWREKTLTQRVAQTGRTGWYLRVIQTGTIQAGQALTVITRPHPDWPVSRANDILFGRLVDRVAVMELMNLPALSDQWKQAIA